MFKQEEPVQQQQPYIPLIKNTLDLSSMANTNSNLLKTPEFYYYYYFNLLSQNGANQNIATINSTASALATKALAIQASYLQQPNIHDINNAQLFNVLLNPSENSFYSNPLLQTNDFLINKNKQPQQSANQMYKNYIGQLASNLMPQLPIQHFLSPNLSKQSILSNHNSNVSDGVIAQQTPNTPTTPTFLPAIQSPLVINSNKRESETCFINEPPRKHPKKQERPKKLKNILNNSHQTCNENNENDTNNDYDGSSLNNTQQLVLNDNFDSASNQSLSTSINLKTKKLEQKNLNLSSDVSS